MKTEKEKLALIAYEIEFLIKQLDGVEKTRVLLDETETKLINESLKDCKRIIYND